MKSRPKKPPHQAAFEDIYERHSREVWALVYARWLNADVALDIMQETFLRLWKQWQDGSDIVNPRAWILRVARNLAIVRTPPGHANGVARAIDLLGFDGLVGSVAGDDTVMIVTEDDASARRFKRHLDQLAGAPRGAGK